MLSWMLSWSFLISGDILENFINKQVKVEKKFLNDALSKKDKKVARKAQRIAYQEFFLKYASDKMQHLSEKNQYRFIINRLKIKIENRKAKKYIKYAQYNRVILQQYLIKESIQNALKDVLRETDNRSKEFFEDKVYEIIVKYFSELKPLKLKKIKLDDLNASKEKDKLIIDGIENYKALESVANTFSSELIDNSYGIYRTATLSKSKIISTFRGLNDTKIGKKINYYLIDTKLDMGKISLLLAVVLLVILIQLLVKYIVDHALHYYKLLEKDIDYIQTHITKIFNYITTLFIFHIIFVINLGVDSKSINISRLFAIIYVILIAIFLYRLTNTIFFLKRDRIKSSKVLKNEVLNLVIKVINGLIITLAVIIILEIFGIDLTALLSGLGIAGAAVAFAAKDSIANIFGSISILVGNVFEQGDWIETKDVDGTVVEIGLRASTIRTFDNALISIPNFELANKGVKNWSRRRIGRRIKMNIGVTYESDFSDIKNAIADIRLMLHEHVGIANEHTSFDDPNREARLVSIEDFKGIKRTTLVYLDEFADSSVNILLYCFSRTVVWSEWLEVKEDIMYKIAEILEKNHLEFAYPALTVHQASNSTKREYDSDNSI